MRIGIVDVSAAEPSSAPPAADRNAAARRLLEKHCVECHGGRATRSGLDLATREGALRGGHNGPALVTGNAKESAIVEQISHVQKPGMPYKRDRLSDADTATITAWIDAGAPYEGPLAKSTAAESETWWSLRPIGNASVPKGAANDNWSRMPIDRFIFAKLAEKGLSPSPLADKRTLLRRVTFDLVGLPPSPDEIAAFLADESPDAYERVVDRLLVSPQFGERWARHWMDVVHYAETHGHDQDRPRPNAWPYRDYLIRSFNEDKPYARFVEEQVAGDILYPEDPQGIVATGLIATGPWDESSLMSINEDTIDRQIARYLDRDDMVATVISTFVSTTVHCARCHDHKFDPIPQEDYYALQAVFAGVDRAERPYDADSQTAARRNELLRRKTEIAARRAAPQVEPFDESIRAEVAAWERKLAETSQIWTPLDPESFVSAQGATLAKQEDLSILSGGTRPESDVYTVVAQTDSKRVTTVRLEVLTDDSLPQKGPGRHDNGNFHLTEFILTASPRENPAAVQLIALQNPTADFNQDNWTIAHAIDGNPTTAWGVHPQTGKPHQAIFELKQPIENTGGTTLTFTLEQAHGRGHVIGRVRLSVASASLPLPTQSKAVPTEIASILAMPAAARSEKQVSDLTLHYLERELDQKLTELPAQNMVYAAANDFKPAGSFAPAKTPRPIHVLHRGDVNQARQEALPGALSCVAGLESKFQLADRNHEGSRRAALAHWISDPRNVLTWRSIVNRVWHYHFGRGIVDSPNDFGMMGATPTHPELLDWLACRFLEGGGSLKRLHKEIVMSAVYMQASRHDARFAEIDGDNRYLWRMNRTRLDAESIRDAILDVTGKLDPTMGGPSVKQFVETKGIHVTPMVDYLNFDPDRPENFRRSVYRFIFRTLPDPFMETLDCADSSQLTPSRNTSVSALQALSMLNNRFIVRQSEHLAEKASRAGTDLPTQTAAIYEWTLGRPATPEEVRNLAEYATKHGLANACRMLLNSNEFMFVN